MIFKRPTLKKGVFKISTLFTLLLASQAVFANDSYKVSTSIFKADELVATPMMLVNPEEQASITIDSDLQYELMVNPYNEHTANVITTLTMDDTVTQKETMVAYGKEATIDLGEDQLTLLVDKIID